jgi:DNA-binding MarR family transcriptional regulator
MARITTDAPAACTCGALRRATRALTQLYDDLMLPSGLRVTQFSLLRTLDRLGPARLTRLADAAMLDRTALSRTLDPLVERGWVATAPGRDARTREAALTAQGRKALRAAHPHWVRAQEQVAARVGERKLDALVGLLREVEELHPDRTAAGAAHD